MAWKIVAKLFLKAPLASWHYYTSFLDMSAARYESRPAMLPDFLLLVGKGRGKAFSSEIKVETQTNWLHDLLSLCQISSVPFRPSPNFDSLHHSLG